MPNYRNTKIYIIRSPNTDRVYIGATTQPLSHRFRDHNSKFRKGTNKCKAIEILKHGGAYIELLESFPCDNIDESSARERHWVRQFDGQRVNHTIPGRTRAEYYQEHKRERAAYDRQYKRDNREKIKKHNSQKYECPCGGKFTHINRIRHLKSLKHKAYLIDEFNKHNIFNHL
jgi:hypothetical protein